MAVILIVEDEIFVRESADWTIGDLGHGTLLAEDLDSALAQLSASQVIDGLFVDIRLSASGLAGYDIANRAVELRPGLRVLYTSGTPLNEAMSAAFVEGGRFLQKPYSPSQLELSIALLLQ